jgi:hypothetical protein
MVHSWTMSSVLIIIFLAPEAGSTQRGAEFFVRIVDYSAVRILRGCLRPCSRTPPQKQVSNLDLCQVYKYIRFAVMQRNQLLKELQLAIGDFKADR